MAIVQAELNIGNSGYAGGLRGRDALLLGLFGLVLFGYAMFWGPSLTLHEARLPETSREMMQFHDWIVPRSGGRPWLERPPLPHWIEIAVSALTGQHCDAVWVVRLPAALMGMMTIVLVAWMAARWFGRWVGISSGLVLATMYEFYRYSTLAEDDIFLAMLVTLAVAFFVRSEWPSAGKFDRLDVEETAPPSASTSALRDPHLTPQSAAAADLGRSKSFTEGRKAAAVGDPEALGFFASRHWSVMGFFIVLGLTSLVKGPLVGAAVVAVTFAGFLAWEWDARRLRRYVWFFGWIVFIALTLWWPIAIIRRFPGVIHNWRFDYESTHQYDENILYYPMMIWGMIAPWTPAALLGLALTWRRAIKRRGSAERFLWCWAILPILLLSIPHRKHHHYLVPSLAPWAVLSVVGLRAIARHMFSGTAWSRRPAFGLLVFGLPGAVALYVFRRKIPGPPAAHAVLIATWIACVAIFYLGLWRRKAWLLMGAMIVGLSVASGWAQSCLRDAAAGDVAFLRQVNAIVPADALLTVNADLAGELYFFRNQFYLRPSAILLHNLSFLRDSDIHTRGAYVVTRRSDEAKLRELGSVELIAQSPSAYGGKMKGDHFALFHVQFKADLQRYPAPALNEITAMQAMGRTKGPYCGPPL